MTDTTGGTQTQYVPGWVAFAGFGSGWWRHVSGIRSKLIQTASDPATGLVVVESAGELALAGTLAVGSAVAATLAFVRYRRTRWAWLAVSVGMHLGAALVFTRGTLRFPHGAIIAAWPVAIVALGLAISAGIGWLSRVGQREDPDDP